MVEPLAQQHCSPCPKGSVALDAAASAKLLSEVNGDWSISADGLTISRAFSFSNYRETMAFANATAWIAEREDHHPDMHLSYRRCRVTYTTHSIGGLSRNDFICAARIDALLS